MNQELRDLLDKIENVKIGVKCNRVPVYKVRVNYKSGISEEFWAFNFEYENNHGAETYTWKKLHKSTSGPIQLNIDSVDSTWLLETEMLTREQAEDVGYKFDYVD